MTPRARIPDLLSQIQRTFGENPRLELALDEAERRFGLDEATCQGLLFALVDTGVLVACRRDDKVRFSSRARPSEALRLVRAVSG